MSALRNERVGFAFDGRDDYIEVPHSTSLWLEEFTVVFWIKAPRYTLNSRIVEKGGWGDPEGGFGIEDNADGRAKFFVWYRGSFYGIAPLDYVFLDNRWHHIAFGYKNLRIYVYADGALRGTRDVAAYAPTTARLTLMRRSVAAGFFHPGLLADFRLYSKLISFAEYNMLYQGVHVRDGLVLHFSPSIPLRDDGKIQDLSGYNNHGIPYGGLRLGVYRAARTVAPARVLARAR